MTIFHILAYIFGGLIVINNIFVFLVQNRRTTLIFKFIGDVIYILDGIFIYFATKEIIIFASVGTSVVGCIRDIVFYFRHKHPILDGFWVPLIFCMLFSLSLIFTYKSPISLLPVIGSLFSTATLFLYNQRYVKIGAIICAIFYIIYFSLLLQSSDILTIFSLASYLTSLIGATIGLIIYVKNRGWVWKFF